MSPPALEARDLVKNYGDTQALAGFNLAVGQGTIHGLLGPNGAGKSTAVSILATLVTPDSGTATVDGIDVTSDPRGVRERIGLVGQHAAVDEILTGRQNLTMFARLLGMNHAHARARADELLSDFGLHAAADKQVSMYSGGMRRRLDIATSLILRPAVLYLDEPTTGLDPRGRGEVWEAVRAVKEQGTTVLLTTQYLDEADQLASTITAIDHGAVVAEGPPTALKRQMGGDRIIVTLPHDADAESTAAALATAMDAPWHADRDDRTVTFEVGDGMVGLAEVVRALDHAGIEPDDVLLRRPTLDEVFLALTDHGQGAQS